MSVWALLNGPTVLQSNSAIGDSTAYSLQLLVEVNPNLFITFNVYYSGLLWL